MNIRKLTVLSLLASAALVIFVAESMMTPLAPIPGIKMGLANIITLVTLVWFGRRDAFLVLLVRIVLGTVFAGQMMSLMYSLSGGILCFLVMALLIGRFDTAQLWVVSVFGALAHNAGQIAAAIAVTRTVQVAAYFPILAVSAVITGAFTGAAAGFAVKHMKKIPGRKDH